MESKSAKNDAAGGDWVSYRGKQWTRRALGAFLNLVVLPGTGSFVLGRRLEGTVQVLTAVIGLGVKITAASVIVARASTEIGGISGTEGLPPTEILTAQIVGSIQSNPPMIAGISAIWLFVAGLALVVFAWLFSFVSTILPPKGRTWS